MTLDISKLEFDNVCIASSGHPDLNVSTQPVRKLLVSFVIASHPSLWKMTMKKFGALFVRGQEFFYTWLQNVEDDHARRKVR
jgi:hypothetical protein